MQFSGTSDGTNKAVRNRYLKEGNMVYPGITETELYPVAVIVNYSGSLQGADPVQQHTLVSVKEGH